MKLLLTISVYILIIFTVTSCSKKTKDIESNRVASPTIVENKTDHNKVDVKEKISSTYIDFYNFVDKDSVCNPLKPIQDKLDSCYADIHNQMINKNVLRSVPKSLKMEIIKNTIHYLKDDRPNDFSMYVIPSFNTILFNVISSSVLLKHDYWFQDNEIVDDIEGIHIISWLQDNNVISKFIKTDITTIHRLTPSMKIDQIFSDKRIIVISFDANISWNADKTENWIPHATVSHCGLAPTYSVFFEIKNNKITKAIRIYSPGDLGISTACCLTYESRSHLCSCFHIR